MKKSSPNMTGSLFSIFLILAIFFAMIYLSVRIVTTILAQQIWYEILTAFFLLFAEGFIIFHGIGYILEIFLVLITSGKFTEKKNNKEKPASNPSIVIVIPSYHEPLDVLENTLTACYNLTFPNKHLFLLDDTRYDQLEKEDPYKQKIEALCKKLQINLFRRPWRNAKAGIINDFLKALQGKSEEDFHFSFYSGISKLPSFKYMAVFDADQNPFLDFLQPILAKLEQDDTLAFVQTPQYYTNFQENRVARASGLQQAVFYEYICEAKNIKNAMFCCGANVVFRIDALFDVGGFDETTVTEDFSTSFDLHWKGWKSMYYNKVSAFGMGPEDLPSYFKQQFRWSVGTLTLLRKILRSFFKNPRKLTFNQWWEYFLSSTYYLIGFVYLILFICPPLYLVFNVPSYFAHLEIYGAIYFPYILASFVSFFLPLKKRGYRVREIFMGQCLILVCFPIYLRALFNAFLGKKKKFEVTIKGKSQRLYLRLLWPQIVSTSFGFFAIFWGFNRIFYEKSPLTALIVNIFWCVYNVSILSTMYYFNNPLGQQSSAEKPQPQTIAS